MRLWFPLGFCSFSLNCCTTLVCMPDLGPSFAVQTTAQKVVWSFNSYHGSAYPATMLSLSSSLFPTWSCSHLTIALLFSLFLTSITRFLSCTFISTSDSLSGRLRLSRRKSAGCCLTRWGIMIWGLRLKDCRSMSRILYWKTCCLGILWKFWRLGS